MKAYIIIIKETGKAIKIPYGTTKEMFTLPFIIKKGKLIYKKIKRSNNVRLEVFPSKKMALVHYPEVGSVGSKFYKIKEIEI